jgi:hypothetical protein
VGVVVRKEEIANLIKIEMEEVVEYELILNFCWPLSFYFT